MLRTVDKEIQSALERIKRSRDGEVFLGWLNDSLADTYSNSVRIKDEIPNRWEQGSAQTLQDLIKCLTKEV